MKAPLVSVCMITYNHEKFIEEAIIGVLEQEVDFDVEFIISNDNSTDATHNIIKELIKANTNKHICFKYFKHKKNIGVMPNFIFSLKQCRGEYIALCDGDDYWTDSLKLQKQVDFMEFNKDYSLCFNKVNVLKNKQLEAHIIPLVDLTNIIYNDILRTYNFIATCSVMFRNFDMSNDISSFQKSPWGDLFLYKLLSNRGKIKCLDDTMAVYRIHDKGMYSGVKQKEKLLFKLAFYRNLYALLTKKEKKTVHYLTKTTIKSLIKINFKRYQFFNNIYAFFYYHYYLLQCKLSNILKNEI